MTQFDDQYSNGGMSGYAEPRQSNPLGVVGFVLSLLCITSPIGLLLSLIALTKAPRGFAIAGTIIGLVFSGLIGLAVWGLSYVWDYMAQSIEIATDFEDLESELTTYRAANDGATPASLDDLSWQNLDPWGNVYEFAYDEESGVWSLTTMGPDSQLGTDDDLTLDSSMDEFDVQSAMNDWIEDRARKDYGATSP